MRATPSLELLPSVSSSASPHGPDLTVVVPTRNEAGNVAELVSRLRAALGGQSAEILVVDDSDDDTPAEVTRAAALPGTPVRLVHRSGSDRTGGLGGAVVRGLEECSAGWVVVMDADLQHPPELVPTIVETGRSQRMDLVVASRHTGHASADGLSGPVRRLVSTLSILLARLFFPGRLRHVSDPMSGFFAVRRDAVDVSGLRPRGFKILLELLVRGRPLAVAEVPFTFGVRTAGESKAGLVEGWRYLTQLLRLRFAARTRRALGFGAVGLSGLVVNTAIVWALDGQGVHYLLAALVATQGSSLWNAVLTEGLVYRGRGKGSGRGRLLRSVLLNNAVLVARVPVLVLLVAGFGMNAAVANAATLLAAFLLRFHVNDRHIYGASAEDTPAEPKDPVQLVIDLSTESGSRPAGRRYLPYRYDIAGVVTVGSEVELRELEWFRSASVGRDLDLEVRVGAVGGGPRRRTRFTNMAAARAVAYEEHLGRLGANFHVDMSDRVKVTAGPLLAHSPHVLYTNVVEAMLRFLMVSRDRVLLHSACLELAGQGVLISARTDTGKTGTVLRLVREHGAQFLSDDMTILSADGTARCFPKPLTISQHTLRAVQADDLSRAEWRRLRLQSRLHSKEGRAFGTLLAEHNLPIMGLNALTQLAVPPPKYFVQRLVDCDVAASTQVSDLFIIERGQPRLERLALEETLPELIDNTDDAYGFPPFRWVAPAVVLGDDDYDELRRKESELLGLALRDVQAHRLVSDSFSWADEIPRLVHDGDRRLAQATAAADLATAAELRAWMDHSKPGANGHAVASGLGAIDGAVTNGLALTNGLPAANGNGAPNGHVITNGHVPREGRAATNGHTVTNGQAAASVNVVAKAQD